MANLLLTESGRQTLNRIACYLARRRMSRRLHRSFYIAFSEYQETGHFNIETMLNELNPLDQDELAALDFLSGELGCHAQLWADQVIHVDSVNGDDTTGDGSSTNPYASFAFVANLPRYVFRNIVILIHGNISIESMDWDFTIGPLGSITISGYGAPEVVNTSQGVGPFVLTGSATIGAPPAGYVLQCAESFAVDELYGKWVRILDGAAAGKVLPIHHSSAVSELFIRHGFGTAPGIGDSFDIVVPPTTVTCQNWNLESRGPKNILDANAEATRFSLWNMMIDMTGAYNEGNQFVCRNTCRSMISFVGIQYDATMSNYMKLESDLNQNLNFSNLGISNANTGITNLDRGLETPNETCVGLSMIKKAAIPGVGDTELYIQGGDVKNIAALDCRGLIQINGRMSRLTRSAFTIAACNEMSSGLFELNYVSGFAGSPSFYLSRAGTWQVSECWFDMGGDIFEIVFGTLLIADPLSITIGGGGFTGHGFVFGRGQGNAVVNADPATLTGVTGDIYFAGGVGTLAHPAADATQSDALGNLFARIETP